MDQMLVTGGNTLQGNVEASGAKNAALPLIFSTLLCQGQHALRNVPQLNDIVSAKQLMDSLGCSVQFKNGEFQVEVGASTETLAHYDQVRKMRASILVLGPLLARLGKAQVSLPGGCAIGARPVTMHLDGLAAMGAQIEVTGGYVHAEAKKLKGAEIHFPFATVGGTENIMMAACLAEGETTINNAAREPEIVDLANYLITMGAKISGQGSSTLKIQGVSSLKPGEHEVIPDRIEVGTLLAAGAITGGTVQVEKCIPDHLESFLKVLEEMGHGVERGQRSIKVEGVSNPKPVQVKTAPYPGFPTDLQAQLMALLTQVNGESRVEENVFENRFMHVQELARLGAQIEIEGKVAKIMGAKKKLAGAPVMATDLRASACLILAGLVAEGETLVSRIYHLDRGYEKLENKISKLGGNIKRIKSS